MALGIKIEGGGSRKEALDNVGSLDSKKALETLQQIRAYLGQPGRDSGVLTLHNRTNSGEMRLERTSGLKMMFQDQKRLDDTAETMKSLLKKAGQGGALQVLDDYLTRGKGQGNKIESSKMLEILNRFLPRGGQGLVEGKGSESLDPPVPPPDHQDGDQDRLEPRKLFETQRPVLPPPYTTKEEAYLARGVVKAEELNSGSYGTTSLVYFGGKELVLKDMNRDDVKPVHRDRSLIDRNNEATAAFLSTGKNAAILDTVNITQPISFMISTKNEGKDEFRLVNAHTLRALLKFESEQESPSEVLCHGLVMPKAKGERLTELIAKGMPPSQQQNFCRSMLESIKGLNERGFVHRDIKPDNAFFDETTGTATLIDTGTLFKESKHENRKDRPHYIDGSGMGSLPHMHPRARAGGAHGTETDLFALGVTTMQMAHPKPWKDFTGMLTTQERLPHIENNDMTWMRDTLDKKIEGLKAQETDAKTENEKIPLKAKREGLEALRRDMDNPNTPTNFAVECFEKTRASVEDWHDRTKAQAMYSELQQHPFLKPQLEQQPV